MVGWKREMVMLVNLQDITDLEIVNASWAVAQMLPKIWTSKSGRTAEQLDAAAWADTERLIRIDLHRIPAITELQNLPEAEIDELAAGLKTHEVQGALQVLLAVRLTDAPEIDAAKAREAVKLALEAGGTPYPARLSEHFDDKISAVVATIEGRVGFKGLAQVRSEAYSARIVALLGAIERQVAALAESTRGTREETELER
jgi:hypothetical protein